MPQLPEPFTPDDLPPAVQALMPRGALTTPPLLTGAA